MTIAAPYACGYYWGVLGAWPCLNPYLDREARILWQNGHNDATEDREHGPVRLGFEPEVAGVIDRGMPL